MKANELIQQVSELGQPVPVDHSFDVFFWILMGFNLVVFALVKTTNPGYIRNLFVTALYNRPLNNNLSERLAIQHYSSILLNLTYFHALAPILLMGVHNSKDRHHFFLALILVGLAVIKMVIIVFLEFILNDKRGLQEHRMNHLIFFQIGGLVLTPILIFTHYISDDYVNLMLIILASIVILLVLIREIQTIIRAIQFRISVFYIILYLCTLEIIPLMVGFRVFVLN